MMTSAMPADDSRRLSRPRDGRMVAGVCAGAGRYFDVDPVIFRVTLAVLVFFGGAGVLVYAAGWLLIPEDGEPQTRLERWVRAHPGDRRRDVLVLIVAVVVLGFMVNGHVGRHVGNGLFLLVIALALAAVFSRTLTSYRDRAASQPRDAGPVYYGPPTADQTVAWSVPATSVTTPVPRRPRSWLGLLTFGATLLTAGVMSLLAAPGAAHPQPSDVLAACVGVVAVGLLVGAFVGRGWTLIPLGIVLVLGLVAADALPNNLTWTAGTRSWAPVVAPTSPYVLGAGNATLDLTALPRGGPETVTARVGAGHLRVIVPSGREVVLHAHAGAGQVVILGEEHNGTGVDVHEVVAGEKSAADPVNLDLSVGYGEMEVQDAAA
jgi:phage shock protein PspC (stress-responsive transcriptional regulator)